MPPDLDDPLPVPRGIAAGVLLALALWGALAALLLLLR
jgi:hypothetical protein